MLIDRRQQPVGDGTSILHSAVHHDRVARQFVAFDLDAEFVAGVEPECGAFPHGQSLARLTSTGELIGSRGQRGGRAVAFVPQATVRLIGPWPVLEDTRRAGEVPGVILDDAAGAGAMGTRTRCPRRLASPAIPPPTGVGRTSRVRG